MSDDCDKIQTERWAAHQEVHRVAEANVNRRLDEMNELRKQITEERGHYVTQEKYESNREAMRVSIDELRKQVYIWTGVVLTFSFLISLGVELWSRAK